MLRRLAAAAAFRLGSTAATGAFGPECSEPVRDAVLAAVQGRAEPGQVIQYLQIIQINGQYTVQLCTVTVPSGSQP